MFKGLTICAVILAQFMSTGTTVSDPWRDEKRPPVVVVKMTAQEQADMTTFQLKVDAAKAVLEQAQKDQSHYQYEIHDKHNPSADKDRNVWCGSLVYHSETRNGYIVYTLAPMECRPA